MDLEERLAVAEYSQVECYQQGYKDAVAKAREWWTNYLKYPTDTDEDRERVKEMVDEFTKGMNDNDKGRTVK